MNQTVQQYYSNFRSQTKTTIVDSFNILPCFTKIGKNCVEIRKMRTKTKKIKCSENLKPQEIR